MNYDIDKIRSDFPILNQMVDGKPLVFLDTTASAQKPKTVIDGMRDFYETSYANIHRGLYNLSQQASTAYENAREKVRAFLNAGDVGEIIFTKNTTEGINLVASSFGKLLKSGDEIILSEAEHHANIVPWMILKNEIGIVIKWLPINDDGSLQIEKLDDLLTDKTKLVAITQMSNVLGIVYDVKSIVKKAHSAGAKVLIDGCQAVVHMPIDVVEMDADFYVLSSHKLYGPSGVGVLYGKKELLDILPPYQSGGGMIGNVTYDSVTFAKAPAKFEAGTSAITEAVGLGLAIDYLNQIGMENIKVYEHELSNYMSGKLKELDFVKVLGTADNKSGIFSFSIEGGHPQDIAMILNKEGVAVRTGHHCAEPLHKRLGVPFTTSTRASLGLYNNKTDIDSFISALKKVRNFL